MGIVMYQLSTGRHPFRADSEIATLRNILDLAPERSPITLRWITLKKT